MEAGMEQASDGVWTPLIHAIPSVAAAIGLSMVLLWLWSLRLRDVSIVDPWWAPGFALGAAVTAIQGLGPGLRPQIALGLITLWALRLGLFLTLRKLGHGEDFRYVAMRGRFGPRFDLWSLPVVFGLQGLLQLLIGLPVYATVGALGPEELGLLDLLGATLALAGIGLEAWADAVLRTFKADPAHKGAVCDRGPWAWSRHPNYFGNALLWWGFGLFALSIGAWPLLFAPALMTFLLLRVSGVALLERDIHERRPAYRDYIERTSAFVPWPPRRRRG